MQTKFILTLKFIRAVARTGRRALGIPYGFGNENYQQHRSGYIVGGSDLTHSIPKIGSGALQLIGKFRGSQYLAKLCGRIEKVRKLGAI